MAQVVSATGIADFDAVRLAVASPEDILKWSYGEVLKPETINYRTKKPERDGLFCERIFGPVKDINPHDSKLKGVRSREAAVDKNGELVTKSIVRRERMGHISLAAPVAHIWFMRGTPSAMSLLTGITVRNLERVAYFATYVILKVDEEKRDQFLADLEAETEAGPRWFWWPRRLPASSLTMRSMSISSSATPSSANWSWRRAVDRKSVV